MSDRLKEFGPAADARLAPKFKIAQVPYPPRRLLFLALKQEKRLEIYAERLDRSLTLVTTYPILAASGLPGPKLREGDRQVPEGFYKIESLNPNSSYHLSLRINYPNASDKSRAIAESRDLGGLGGDIMIHGRDVSIGCLAIGDPAVEEVFVLAARTGVENIDVILAPCDFRKGASVPIPASAPSWTNDLHAQIRDAMKKLPH